MSFKRWLRGGGQVFITPGPASAPGRTAAGRAASTGRVVAAVPASARNGGTLGWGPVQRPIGRVPITGYGQRITGVPLQPGQASGTVPASGTITLSIGPTGYGNVWYPASATVSTTTGVLDTSTCNIYLGPANTPVTLLGQIFTGNGVLSAALPTMAPGQYLIAIWTGAHQGDTAAINIVGTMDTVSG